MKIINNKEETTYHFLFMKYFFPPELINENKIKILKLKNSNYAWIKQINKWYFNLFKTNN